MSRMVGDAFKKLGSVGLDFSSPTMALGIGVPTALFGADIAQGIGSAVKQEATGFNKVLDEEMRRRRQEAAQAMRARRLQKAMADNMMRLAAANPQLYNQLLMGRTLPQGAVVIGGGPKSDFLESVAYQMATGGFGNPQTSPDSPDMIRNLVASY